MEFVRDSHVHGLRDGRLQLVAGPAGAGASAEILREYDLDRLDVVWTLPDSTPDPDLDAGPTWSMSWGDPA